ELFGDFDGVLAETRRVTPAARAPAVELQREPGQPHGSAVCKIQVDPRLGPREVWGVEQFIGTADRGRPDSGCFAGVADLGPRATGEDDSELRDQPVA